MTAEHDQRLTLHVLTHIPEHDPRENDPSYHLFQQAKAKLKRNGLWKCVLNDDYCSGGPELHHQWVEFSQINSTDPDKVGQLLGLHFADDGEFQEFIEGPGNLEVLCAAHHRTQFGIHVLPGPLWNAVRFHRAGIQAPAQFVPAKDWNKHG